MFEEINSSSPSGVNEFVGFYLEFKPGIIWANSKFTHDNYLEGYRFVSVVESCATWNQVEAVLLGLLY